MASKKILFVSGYMLLHSLPVAGISMPKGYNPVVANVKAVEIAQKSFKKVCLSPSESELESLRLIREHTLCRVAPLPSEEGCNDIIQCYINKFSLGGEYKFHLDDSSLSDLSPFQYFLRPERFVLDHNNISDLTPLSKLKNIADLSLRGNPIVDISPLKSLKVYDLSLNETPLKDISSLQYIDSLEVLRIGSDVEDLTPLRDLKKLRLLYLTSRNTLDICQIKDLVNMKSLTIDGGNISDISCLISMSKMESLTLKNIPIKDISVIRHFKKLKFLDLQNVPVENVDNMEHLNELSVVTFINTGIKDLSVLTKMSINGHRVFINDARSRENDSLVRCSPKNDDDIEKGRSCYDRNGDLKPFWKRWIGI
jgi:hypothetical protein